MTRQGIALVAMMSAFAAAGCGAGDPPSIEEGALAEAAPPDTAMYGEVVVRPGDDVTEQIDGLFETLGADDGEDERDVASTEILRDLSVSLDSGPLDYDDDIKPWLGSRIAGFLTLANETTLREARLPGGSFGPGAAQGALIIPITDADAAEEFAAGLDASEQDRPEGVDFLAEAGASTLAIAGDRMVFGDEESVNASLEALEGDSLADQTWFGDGLEGVAGEEALAFGILEGSSVTDASLIDAGPRFADRYGNEVKEGLVYEPDAPLTVAFHASESGFSVDTGYEARQRFDVEEARRLVEELPGDAWLAYADPLLAPTLLESFAIGVEIGLKSESIGEVIARLGYDPSAALDRFSGVTAVYAAGDDPADLEAGLFLGVKRPVPGVYAVDAARFVIATTLPNTSIPRRSLDYGGPFSFRAEVEGFPSDLLATEARRKVGVVYGQEALPEAFEPAESVADSGALDSAEARLGKEWTALGYADLEQLLSVLSVVGPAFGAVPIPDGDLPDGSQLSFGVRVDGDRATLRYQYGVD